MRADLHVDFVNLAEESVKFDVFLYQHKIQGEAIL